MKFLFKYRDFAKSAWSLAASMLALSLIAVLRTKDMGMVTGLLLGMPLGVLALWVFYSIKLQMRRRPKTPELDLKLKPADVEMPHWWPAPHPLVETVLSPAARSSQDLRTRQLLGRDPLNVPPSKTANAKSMDQWHR